MTKQEGGAPAPVETTKAKEKIPAAAIKRPTRKKPKDKPKRPLSAYNFFFKEEREKILKIVLAEDPSKVENEADSEDYISEEMMTRLKKEGGKVSFEEMGKLIGQRWKNIDPDRLSKYSEMAAEDTERYKKEMQSYNGRQEAKMRSEALKPPAWNGGGAKGDSVGGSYPGLGKGGGAADVSRSLPGGLPSGYGAESMAAQFANQAAAAAATMGGGYGNPYAGMDMGGYLNSMYPGYGGYGMGPDAGMGGRMPQGAGAGGAAAAQSMYANQMMMGGAGGFNQAAGMMGGYGGPVDPYGGQAGVGGQMDARAMQQYGMSADQMAYAAQGYGADPSWGGQ